MHRLKNRGIVVLAVLGLFALSGIAMADTEDDTIVNYHIDYEQSFLALNITSLEYAPNFAELFEALSEECSLQDSEGDYSFSFDGAVVTLNDGVNPVDLGACGDFIGGFFFGPNGQTNQGMVMKFLNSIYDGPGRGCVIREFAHLGLGKVDKKQADPEFVVPDLTEPLVSDVDGFMTFETNCLHGNQGENGGPPKHVLDKWELKWPEGKPGKPAHAGGPNG